MIDASLQRAGLSPLMRLSAGRADVAVGLIDGPVQTALPAFAGVRFRQGEPLAVAGDAAGPARVHATLVASLLAAARDDTPSGICPACTFVLHPIFAGEATPRASPAALAAAIEATVAAGVHVINLSVALEPGPIAQLDTLRAALDRADRRGVIIVAAAGNQARIGHSLIASHPAVLPVAACDPLGRPTSETNLGRSIGQRGVSAPGAQVVGLRPDGQLEVFGGTSAAAPFVTGTIALLYALLPGIDRRRVIWSLTGARRPRARLVPPLLDAWAAYKTLTGNGLKDAA